MKTNLPSSGGQPKRTLGPISDLERHLPMDWWKKLFNAIYLKTDADLVESERNTVEEVDEIIRLARLKPSDRILDLCCGQGRHCLELASRGFEQVVGLDRSKYLIRLARRRAKRAGFSIGFHEGDARKLRFKAGAFDTVVILGNSFGYFEQESEDEAVLKAVRRVLRSQGTLMMDVTDGEWMLQNFEARSWEWIDQEHFVCRERSVGSDGRRLISREVVVNAEEGVIADQFYAERLYSQDQIVDLLGRAGFENIAVAEHVSGKSERNQDLGMMARRMLVTASAPVRSEPVHAVEAPPLKVTVLLGDASMPDQVKRGGKFNPEDLETIRILREALAELDGFEFNYLDDHEALVDRLRADAPDFVFNLCDEGFVNDATKELHVPALLEMLEVKYTGAGPACLGLCYDKSLVRAYAMAYDIPVPMETYVDSDDFAATIPAALPALVKPNTGDSSIGITKDAVVSSPQELIAYLKRLRSDWPGRAALIQEYLTGREFSVGLVGNPGVGFLYLPVLEVDYGNLDPALPKILGYESKWEPDSPYWNSIAYRPAEIADDLRRQLYDSSALLFERLRCRDYARFDFRADSAGVVKLLEVNPNPGWCWDGKLNLMAGFDGMSYAQLLDAILRAASDRLAVSSRANKRSGTAQ
jgi:D-alanine-D-alanine ligase